LNSTPIRLASALLGIALLVWLIWRSGPANLLANMRSLGWGLALIIALGGVAHLVKSRAWQLALLDHKHQVSFARLFGLRLASEAAGQFGLFGQAVGETIRVSLLNTEIPLAGRIASVAMDRLLFIVSTIIVTVAGLVVLLAGAPLPHRLAICAWVVVFAFSSVLLFAAMAARQRWGVTRWLKLGDTVHSIEQQLLEFSDRVPRAFYMSLGLNIVCQSLAILEVYLTLRLMRFRIGFAAALAAEALTKLVNTLGALTPGNVGLYEGGNMLIAKLFGFTGTAGLAVAVVRRSRAIFWAVIGGLCFFSMSKRKTVAPSKKDSSPATIGQGAVAVILANDSLGRTRLRTPLSHVHGLPVLLRAVLRARKAGVSRVVVVAGAALVHGLERQLSSTGRVPDCVEWLEVMPGDAALSSAFGALAGGRQDTVIIIDGGGVYHPHLYRQLCDWRNEAGALSFTCAGKPIGLYALSPKVVAELATHVPSAIDSISDFQQWITANCSVQTTTVEQDKWQPVLTTEDRVSAERKLDRWIVKPTDGIFARFNRKISIPISHQIIKFPITPNMVSIFTLGVSILAGVFFARGGYWNVLLGAALSLAASILDGCDGEVARLKLLESDFGCWLETACDYLYYLLIYAGMSIGLARASGNPLYLKLGGLFFFGAISTFLISWLQRRQLTNGRPDQLLAIWQKKAESRPSNPLLYFGRRLEFLVRRCFLPYALLFFAAFNILKFAFILSALGVNIAWPIALYSYWAFSPVKRRRAARTPVAVLAPKMPNAKISI
jgi:phosphatidylglycerophosphate synthase